jgi:hypothetical protein
MVLNQPVFVNERTAILDRRTGKPLSLAELSVNDHIQVSGLRQADGDIVASRLDVITGADRVELIGPLSLTEEGQWQINEQPLVVDPAMLSASQSDMENHLGSRVWISGSMVGDQIVVEAMDQDSIDQIFERVNELIYEGYLFEDGVDGALNIGGQAFHLPDNIDLDRADWDNEPIQINAHQLGDGDFEAYDLWIESDDGYYDLLPELDWEDVLDEDLIEDGVYDESSYDDGAFESGYDSEFDQSLEQQDAFEAEYYDEEVYYQDELYYEEDVYYEESYEDDEVFIEE